MSSNTFVRASDSAVSGAAATPIVTAYPMTFFCRFRLTVSVTSGVYELVTQESAATPTTIFMRMEITATNVLRMRIGEPVGGNSSLTGTTEVTRDVWHSALGVYRSATDRQLYLDGVSQGTSTSSRAFPAVNIFKIGKSAIASSSFEGQIADAAFWDVDASAYALALHNGLHPLKVLSASCKFYCPLSTTSNRDWIANKALTNTAITRSDESPRAQWLGGVSFIYVPAATGGTIVTRTLSDSFLVGEPGALSSQFKIRDNSALLSDLLDGSATRTGLLLDLLGLVDGIDGYKVSGRLAADSADAADQGTRYLNLSRLVSSLVDTSDQATRSISINRLLLSLLDIADAANAVKERSRALGDLVEVVDQANVSTAMFRLASSLLSVSDSMERQYYANRILLDSVDALDATIVEFVRTGSTIITATLLDLLSVADTHERYLTIHRALLSSLSASDSVLSYKLLAREFVDLLTTADLLDKYLVVTELVTESVETLDTLVIQRYRNRWLMDNVELNDLLIQELTQAGSTIITALLSDNISMLDFRLKVELKIRGDAEALSDYRAVASSSIRSSAAGVSDARAKELHTPRLSNLSLGDGRSATLGLTRPDNADATDTTYKQLVKYLTDNAELLDFLTSATGTVLVRALIDSIELTSNLVKFLNYNKSLTDGLAVSDVLVQEFMLRRVLTDIAVLADTKDSTYIPQLVMVVKYILAAITDDKNINYILSDALNINERIH